MMEHSPCPSTALCGREEAGGARGLEDEPDGERVAAPAAEGGAEADLPGRLEGEVQAEVRGQVEVEPVTVTPVALAVAKVRIERETRGEEGGEADPIALEGVPEGEADRDAHDREAADPETGAEDPVHV